ncbi:MAG: hypothetical protein JNK76_18075 [Planctomycetales bacterium]|nr:hypothetical protein [Planctomycetales bacterium]MBN8628361.1 hypothetical protein [Planctomycetota bacterium]
MRLRNLPLVVCGLMSVALPNFAADARAAGPLIPGSGRPVTTIGDDFEDPEWEYVPNWPKSSNNMDKRTRNPGGFSRNGRWFEAALRGQPDYVMRVDTPPGGLPGSKGALMLRTLQSGIPGSPSFQDQQDDFIANVRQRCGGPISVSYEPSIVTRVYMPPVEQWERRSGSQFAMRAGVRGGAENEEYWPGIFIQFQNGRQVKTGQDGIFLVIRADGRGQDIRSIPVTQTGWWTLGMSFTGDGRVHYFAKPGIDNLTAEDYLASYVPYNMPCRIVETFFYDCFNRDDGKTWSTPFVIDDPTLYVMRGADRLEAYGQRFVQKPKPAAAPQTTQAAQPTQQRTTTQRVAPPQQRTAQPQRTTAVRK